jgi:hypothetical protein
MIKINIDILKMIFNFDKFIIINIIINFVIKYLIDNLIQIIKAIRIDLSI